MTEYDAAVNIVKKRLTPMAIISVPFTVSPLAPSGGEG